MRGICYHVATTLDGFIARPDGSIDGFLAEGDHVDDYNADLADYDTVIMGRRTYEFGYEYGLEPGKRAYENMEHWIFSKTLDAPTEDGVHIVRDNWLAKIDELRNVEGPDVYLCGGSIFAGWLLTEQRIDRLKLKVNPIVFGSGLSLFASQAPALDRFDLIDVKKYNSGVLLNQYQKRPAD